MEATNKKTPSEDNKKPFLRKKVIISVLLICFAFFGSFILYFVLQVSLNNQTPIVVVVSGSMTPTINKGDILFVQGRDPSLIQKSSAVEKDGDVIVFNAYKLWSSAPLDPIVHRVIDKWYTNGSYYFRTQGDANSLPDPVPIREDFVIGVVVGGIPFIGWIKIVLTDTGLLIPLLVIISALLIISIIRDFIKEEEKNSDKESESLKRNKLMN
ncbi:MAG: signal peptidase I [Promethearchaeota archaeon]